MDSKGATNVTPKNTICLWFDKDAHDAAQFYAATFPDSQVTAVHQSLQLLTSCSRGGCSAQPVGSTSAPPRGLDGGDVDLFHRHHRVEGTLGLAATSRKRPD